MLASDVHVAARMVLVARNEETKMHYEASLVKGETYWWDEDMSGSFIFVALSDDAARRFVTIVVQRMNRKYWRIGEPRNISVESIVRLGEHGFSVVREPVNIWMCLKPLGGLREVRSALRAFYPRSDDGRRGCIAGAFTEFEPIRRYK